MSSCRRSSRQLRKVAADVSLPSQCSPRHEQVNHAQRNQPSGRNRPSGKDRTPLLLRYFGSQHSGLRKALMVPHGADIGVHMRSALVGFCGLTAEGKAWLKAHFSHEAWETVDGRTVWADWRSTQRAISALSETGLACLNRSCMNRLAARQRVRPRQFDGDIRRPWFNHARLMFLRLAQE